MKSPIFALLKKANEMGSDYKYIERVSNTRLAEMLAEHNKWRRGMEPPYDKGWAQPPFEARELGAIIDEAARRLKASDRHEPKTPFFNDEKFNV